MEGVTVVLRTDTAPVDPRAAGVPADRSRERLLAFPVRLVLDDFPIGSRHRWNSPPAAGVRDRELHDMISPIRGSAHLAAVASAVPPFVVGVDETVARLHALFPDEDPAFVRGIVERSGVEQRHISLPVEEAVRPRSFTDRNNHYHRIAADLAEQACRRALRQADVAADEIDVVIDVSCTGIAIPALDTVLSARLGLRPDVKRIPITEAGCAAGTLALGLAASLAELGRRSLVVAVELCSLTLVQGDRTRTNLVASVLFGDGAAAAVVTPSGPGPRFEAVGSHLFRDSRGAMGFDVGEHGLRLVLQRELPRILENHLKPAIDGFLDRHGRSMADVNLHLVHPGGRRVLETYQEMYGLSPEDLECSYTSLRRFGNLSSAAILTVLELALSRHVPGSRRARAFMISFGPGLSAEMAMLDWTAGG